MSALLLAQTGHSLPLPPDPVVVGSDPSAQVPVRADLGIAARHYQIQPDPAQNGHWVVSLLPEHPVLVNGQPVPHALLRDGDVITAGELHLMYRAAVAEAPVMAATMPMAMPAMPSMPPPMPPQPPQEPAAPPVEMDAPRSGYRIPGAPAPGTVMEENLDYLSEGARQKILRERMMKEAAQRTQQQLDALKVEQNFGRACLGAFIVLAVGSFLYLRLDHMSIKLWLPGTALLGQFLGWIIRRTGKGQERRFGLLAGVAAMLCVSAAGLLDYRAAEAKYQAESEMAEESEYSEDTAPEGLAERLVTQKIDSMTADMKDKMKSHIKTMLRENLTALREEDPLFLARIRRDYPELLEELRIEDPALYRQITTPLAAAQPPPDPTLAYIEEPAPAIPAMTAEEEDAALAAEEAAAEAEFNEQMEQFEAEYGEAAQAVGKAVEAGVSLLLFAWILFNPKALVAYFIIGGAAYRAAFRYLSSEEASRLHLGGERQQDMSGKSLKERMQMNRTS
jgi:hypothetical protein